MSVTGPKSYFGLVPESDWKLSGKVPEKSAEIAFAFLCRTAGASAMKPLPLLLVLGVGILVTFEIIRRPTGPVTILSCAKSGAKVPTISKMAGVFWGF